MDFKNLTISNIIKGYQKKTFSATEIVSFYFKRINKFNSKLNAYLSLDEEGVMIKAKNIDKKIAENKKLARLEGVPLSVKDNFCTKDFPTTASSKVLADYRPPYNATVINKLLDNGALILGKTNLDSWAHGSSTETSDFGPTLNPWNYKYLPGGSSGGSATTVAAQLCAGSIGSETAGSIRQPASWCGVLGLKPTYGRVSRYGLIAMASSTDSPGVITNTVDDSQVLLSVIAGKDNLDATSADEDISLFSKPLNIPQHKLTLGICQAYFSSEIDKEVKDSVFEAIKYFEKKGHKIKEISLLDPHYSVAVYTILQRSEVSSNLGRYDGIRYGNNRTYFNEEGKRRIMLGTYTLSSGFYDAYYLKALKVRTLICQNFAEAFKNVDLIIAPTTPTTALPLGSSKNSFMFGELQDLLLEPSSIAGLPAMNLPSGIDKKGLPIGIQIIGPQFSERRILELAYEYEIEKSWSKLNLTNV